ncbi:hypothetical protein [Mesorhizobium sp. LjNodule214]|uniref:hypothetical protein n=1 Tax=Mesorhizobium sp. LjNodule214 TaxID=3342252 RepID=UPI003ED055C4
MTKPISEMTLAELDAELAAIRAVLAWRRAQREAYKLIYAGDLPTFKLGGTVSARRSSILATIAAKEAAANVARAAA